MTVPTFTDEQLDSVERAIAGLLGYMVERSGLTFQPACRSASLSA
jgi:hypothetical protein